MKPISQTTRIRIFSAIVAVIGLVAITLFSGYIGIAITTFFISAIALFEFGRMTLDGPRYKIARYYFWLLGLVAFVTSIVRNDWILHSFVLSTLLLFIVFLLIARDESAPLEELVNKAGLCLLGILYAGVCPVYICLLARLSSHLEWFFFALCVVFSGDVVAYFVGRAFGKSTLFTRISPHKSIEGAIGSLFASVVVGLLMRKLLLPDTDLFLMTALSILTSCVAQLGDLCESLVKRSFRTKDSGNIMPGHGGVLDRVDGILFGAPLVYIFAKYVILS
jgi:phosphatidate cytidylyltransferase